jgi:hypothetical protein
MVQFARDHARIVVNTPGKELMQLTSAAIAVFQTD